MTLIVATLCPEGIALAADSKCMMDGSRFMVHGSWLRVKGSWFTVMTYKKDYKKKDKTEVVPYNRKRGKLAPLMKEEEKASIHELSYDFACRITRLYQYLTEDAEYKEYVQSKQLYRSGTSVGANVRESKHAQSDADFLSKMSIAYKEADESDYWLNLLHDNGYLDETQFNSLNIDLTRILKILTSIVKTMNKKVHG